MNGLIIKLLVLWRKADGLLETQHEKNLSSSILKSRISLFLFLPRNFSVQISMMPV